MWICFSRLLFLIPAALLVSGMMPIALAQSSFVDLPADCSAYAATPLPAEADRLPTPKAPPACASYRSYRGLGRPVNYTAARACAWQERLAAEADLGQNEQEPLAWMVGGPLILADIYFNGAGVERNVPLAMRFACESEEGLAQLALAELRKLNGMPRASKRFEFCDYAASTLSMNYCTSYASEIEDDRRTRYYLSLESGMTAEQKFAFDKLLSAEAAFIKAHALEVDQGGTIRVIRTLGSQNILQDLFRAELVRFERKQWPVLSAHQLAAIDTVLRRVYDQKVRELKRQTPDMLDQGAVSPDHLASAQLSWESYREAWTAFARLRYPAAADAIRAQISQDRSRFLRTIASYN